MGPRQVSSSQTVDCQELISQQNIKMQKQIQVLGFCPIFTCVFLSTFFDPEATKDIQRLDRVEKFCRSIVFDALSQVLAVTEPVVVFSWSLVQALSDLVQEYITEASRLKVDAMWCCPMSGVPPRML